MSKIKILSENLANQIAAGEVIERPASVVKELLENAIDAGASQIAIQVEGGGSRLIRVIDDGEGMDQDDILLCLERHATSKLIDEDGLAAIRTLGFRGEAISSIASVSKMTITSRQADSSLGACAEVRFGRVMKAHEMGCGLGTVIEVGSLFGNVPVRRKFLKSVRTELSHIEGVIRNYALASHLLGITYTVDGREVLSLPAGADTLEERMRRLAGRGGRGPLVSVESDREGRFAEERIKTFGYLLPPDESYGAAASLKLFVNNRVIRDRMVAHAVAEGLHGFLMKGRGPSGALFLEVPPDAVDVNVHPAKQEVRFRKPNVIHDLVASAVRQGIELYQEKVRFSLFGPPDTNAKNDSKSGPRKAEMTDPDGDPAKNGNSLPGRSRPVPAFDVAVGEQTRLFGEYASRKIQVEKGGAKDTPVLSVKKQAPAKIASDKQQMYSGREMSSECAGNDFRTLETGSCPEMPTSPDTASLKYLGQLLQTYLLCEGSDGLVAIDQHAAHERLLFETLKNQVFKKGVARQTLLFPEVLEFSASEVAVLEQYQDEIASLGVEMEPFGGESYVVKAVPAMLAHISTEDVVREIIGRFKESGPSGKKGRDARMESVLATMACKAAIKAGQSLLPEEVEHLLGQIREMEVFSHCPHGRPVYKYFSVEEIKRWFHRT